MVPQARFAAEPLEPRLLLAVFTVTSNFDVGAGTLRQAVLSANATPAADVIQFDIPASRSREIYLTTPLPVITAPLMVDATTQPGYAGSPLVLLRARNVGLSFRNAGDIAVRGLSVTEGFEAIRVVGGTSAVIEGNWIGVTPDGTVRYSMNTRGVSLVGAVGARIGGTSPEARNVIVASEAGVWIGADSSDVLLTRGAVVTGNYIGTDPTGMKSLGGKAGVVLARGSEGNLIGGAAPGARNLISGHSSGGVMTNLATAGPMAASNNRIEGNWIGVNAAGAALPNGRGVYIGDGSTGNVVGGTAPGAGNVISGNTAHGVHIEGTDNRVEGNWIGVDPVTGASAVPFPSGITAYPYGVTVERGQDGFGGGNVIGGAAPGAGNVISGQEWGVRLSTPNNRVLGNFIGTDAAGNAPVPNTTGIWVESADAVLGAAGNEIGGAAPGEGNVISGNRTGIWTRGTGATGTRIAGNLIGLNAAGNARVGTPTFGAQSWGIWLSNSNNIVGVPTPDGPAGARNVISGNATGVWISVGNNNVIRGNYIGTDLTGTFAVGNSGSGVDVEPPMDEPSVPLVGSVIEDNVLSGNQQGVYVLDGGGFTRIIDNFIGTDASGTAAVPNTGYGVRLHYSARLELLGNVISGNRLGGLEFGPVANGTVAGNRIGVTAPPARPGDPPAGPLGNGGHGVTLGQTLNASDRITITDNVIAHNASAGIFIGGGRHAFGNNAIYSNGGLGIDLAPEGVNPNDGRVNVNQPNSHLDHPVITGVYPSGNKVVVVATLSGIGLNGTSVLQFYLSPEADPSGFGEGAEPLVHSDVRHFAGAGVRQTFVYTFDRPLPAGQFLTATATRTLSTTVSETSEFSAAVPVPAPDENPPRVSQVYFRGVWSDAFTRHLESAGLGSAAFGYAVPGGAAQLDTLPWSGARSINVRFTKPVNVGADDLVVRGGAGEYAARLEDYDPVTFTARWVLTAGLTDRADRLTLDLNGDAATGVTDLGGSSLDGEWTNGADAYPSGDGAAGGNFQFVMSVLPGDADRRGGRVDASDVLEVRRRMRSTATGQTAAGYSVFADLDGSAAIDILDLALVRRSVGRSLPVTLPQADAVRSVATRGAPQSRHGYAITAALLSDGDHRFP
jgi:hypothetical protein